MTLHDLNDSDLVNLIEEAMSQKAENPKIEFKDARGGLPNEVWRTISSFSNTPGGGVVVFGILEDRTTGTIRAIGGLDLAVLQENITNLFNDTMINAGRADHRILQIDGHSILAVIVSPISDESKPCYHRKHGIPNGAFVREGNTDRRITDEEMRQFIRNSRPFKFDKTADEAQDLTTLNDEKIKDFLAESAKRVGRPAPENPTPETLLNINIAGKALDGAIHPTVAGMLIFSRDAPQIYNPYARFTIRCVRFAGSDVTSGIVDKADIAGTLDDQIDATYAFILRNIPQSATIQGTKRVDEYAYPIEALREIVANAVIHRDYMITQTYTQVRIFADRIEVTNPGNLPPGVTIENIKDAQFSRNEAIASILNDMDYLEEYGQGIDIIIGTMQKKGLLKPIFRNLANTFTVTLLSERFKVLNSRQALVWEQILKNGSMGASELQLIFHSVSRPTLNGDLTKLVSLGFIKQVGQSRNTRYEINE